MLLSSIFRFFDDRMLKLGRWTLKSVLCEHQVPMKSTILFTLFGIVCGVEYSILNITKCSSSGKTVTVDYCHLDENHKTVVVSISVHEKVTAINVSLSAALPVSYFKIFHSR